MIRGIGKRILAVAVPLLLGLSVWFTVYGGGEMSTSQQSSKVLSTDFSSAEQALAESVDRRAVDQISAALDSQFLEIKLQAAEALGKIADKSAVPKLITALEDNQAYYTGGSETRALQLQLNTALVTALQKLTESDFGEVDPESMGDINQVLQTSRAWQANNP